MEVDLDKRNRLAAEKADRLQDMMTSEGYWTGTHYQFVLVPEKVDALHGMYEGTLLQVDDKSHMLRSASLREWYEAYYTVITWEGFVDELFNACSNVNQCDFYAGKVSDMRFVVWCVIKNERYWR
ncbi:MAG: hypothetical protein LBQ66_07690 [Planctomycetaceae bacterium]|jgi:hypothetical protein|nr:hypothetical protein [Planctomycetaceae bacterium]